jgi:phosphate transport system substrate-binding protein
VPIRAAFCCLLLLAPALPAVSRADDEGLELPPPYAPLAQLAGTLTIWGHGSYGRSTDFVEGLTRSWEEGFREHQPGIHFVNRLHGTASAIGALYTGAGDLALMGREIWAPEIAAFEEVRGYPPTGVEVMTGSHDVRNRGYAITVFVHKENPIAGLTLAELDAIFGADLRRGHAPVATWGDLGLEGAWADKPVNLYGLPIARGFAEFIEQAVFLGGHKWQPRLREFADSPGSRGGASDGGQKLLDALATDRYGIGYAGMLYGHPDVRPVPLAREPGQAYVLQTRASVTDRSYPLTRVISMYFDREPAAPVDPRIREFLRYVLSRDGQERVIADGRGYLPLPAPIARRELAKLSDPPADGGPGKEEQH